MHQIAKFYQRRGLALIIAGSLALLPVWLSLRSLPRMVTHRPLTGTLPPLILTSLQPPPPPVHSNSRLLPFRYWNHRSMYPERYTDNSCMKFPSVSELQYAANSWQLLPVTNGSVYVYGAYYDDRFEEPLVRILIYTDVTPIPKLFCQLWFPDDNEPQTELAKPMYAWHPRWGGYMNGINEPYVLVCGCRRHPPDTDIPPVAVAVVSAPCGVATNVLDIQNAPFTDPLVTKSPVAPRHNGTNIAVCLKWLHYRDDVTVQVAEWLQLLRHFGAEKVFMHVTRVHLNTRKLLKYYEDEGFVVVTELSHPPQVSGLWQSPASRDFRDYRRELLPLNDCLYRNIGQYDWIATFDLDEIIVPPPGMTWPELIDNEIAAAAAANSLPFDAMVFPNYYILDGAQKDLVAPAKTRILAHTWRTKTHSPPGIGVKSFFNVSSVTTMHNHSPLSCKGVLGSCRQRSMFNGTSRMLHYREKCPQDRMDCTKLDDVVREDILNGWRGPVLIEVREILEKLELEGFW